MTFNHDDIQLRAIDFLYDELDSVERAAFDAHLAACERCRDQVRQLGEARATGRAVVRSPLADPIPSGSRARILEAARRAIALRAHPAVAPAAARDAPDPRDAVRVSSTPERPAHHRWWSWLRVQWTLPLFATVAAMAVLILDRENIFREASRPLHRGSPAAPPPPLAANQGSGDERGDKPAAPSATGPASDGDEATQRARPPHGRIAKGNTPNDPAVVAMRDRDVVRRTKIPPSKRATSEVAPDHDRGDKRGAVAVAPQVVARPRAAPNDTQAGSRAASASGTLAESGAPAERKEYEFQDSPGGGPSPGPATSAAPVDNATPTVAMKSRPEAQERAAAAAASHDPAAAPSSDPAAAASTHADKLLGDRRWSEAIAFYRDLLRRFPQHRFVPAWRRQLATAEAALKMENSKFATPPSRN